MKKESEYDLIVVGAGSGGLNVASFINSIGLRVLLIDKSDWNIGGDCLNYGCVPSKALIHASRLVSNARDARKYGIALKGRVELEKVMSTVKEKQKIIRKHENASWFRKKGLDVALGKARFFSKRAVEVNGKLYRGRRILLATGSRPRQLSIPGIERVKVWNNENIWDMKKLPKRLLVIGGGPIGIELGQAFQNLGSEVTVVQRGPQFLPKERPEIALVLRKRLEKEGMRFLFNSAPVRFSGNKRIIVRRAGHDEELVFDEVLVSIGRVLNIEDLNLDVGGIKLEKTKRKLLVDKYLRTTNKRVFVAGDVAGSYQFTHMAEVHAKVLITNWLKPRFLWRPVSYDTMGWVTYTSPEIATFGLSEGEILKRALSYEKLELDFSEDDRAIVDEATHGKLLLFLDRKGRLLGGSMAAENAGELVQELMLLQAKKMKLTALLSKVYPYPVAGRINKRVAGVEAAKALTPLTKKLMRILY